jgi:hypothetical protein
MVQSAVIAEVADRLEVRVDRGQPGRHGRRQLVNGLHAAGDGFEGAADRPQVEHDPDQADRGEHDDQARDGDGHPGCCWHDFLFLR